MNKHVDHYSITTDPKFKLDDKIFFDISNDEQNFFGQPLSVVPTKYDDFFNPSSVSFDMNAVQPEKAHQNQPSINKLRIDDDNETDSRNLQYDGHLAAKFEDNLHRKNLNIHASQV